MKSLYLLSFCLFVAVIFSRESHLNDCEINARCSKHCFFHGTCQTDGSCKCHTGWKGENCTEKTCPVDTCKMGSCKSDGGCQCSRGWTGSDCSVMVGGMPFTHPICDIKGNCVCDSSGNACPTACHVSAATPTCPTGSIGIDLAPNPDVRPFVEWKHFGECDCAVDEPCVGGSGDRKLLKFSMESFNIGTADLFVGSPGDYLDVYVWHQCHQHAHFTKWLEFTLENKGTGEITKGWKSGSSVVDSRRFSNSGTYSHRKYTDNIQGLQKGWADWYPYYLDCQWVDITDVAHGYYLLHVETNPASAGEKRIRELNYTNNKITYDLTCSGCTAANCNFGTCVN